MLNTFAASDGNSKLRKFQIMIVCSKEGIKLQVDPGNFWKCQTTKRKMHSGHLGRFKIFV